MYSSKSLTWVHFIFLMTQGSVIVIIFVLQMRKLRYRDVKVDVQGLWLANVRVQIWTLAAESKACVFSQWLLHISPQCPVNQDSTAADNQGPLLSPTPSAIPTFGEYRFQSKYSQVLILENLRNWGDEKRLQNSFPPDMQPQLYLERGSACQACAKPLWKSSQQGNI